MALTLCPVALTAGCRRCLVFRVCPLKQVIGDQSPQPQPPESLRSARKRSTARPHKR
jgi:hypothetical protein